MQETKIDDIASSLMESMDKDEVSPEAEQQAAEKAAEFQKGEAPILDNQGQKFNSHIHAVDSDGNPRFTKSGRFMKKRGGAAQKLNLPKSEEQKREETQAQIGTYEAACAATAIYIQTGVALFGDEWQPEQLPHASEEEVLIHSFDRYFQAKGVYDIPPGFALAIGLGSYAARRLSKPKTRTRFEQFKDWAVGKFYTYKSKRNKKDASHSGDRKDGQRENNAGQKDSASSQGQGKDGSGIRSLAGKK
jgi:hypothetical protein